MNDEIPKYPSTQPTPEFRRHLQYLADIMAINLDCPAIASIPDEVYRDMAKKQTQPRKPRVKKPPPRLCGNCPWLAVNQRTDFTPYSPEFWCGLTGRWVGFRPVTPEWCLPVIQSIDSCTGCRIQDAPSTPLRHRNDS